MHKCRQDFCLLDTSMNENLKFITMISLKADTHSIKLLNLYDLIEIVVYINLQNTYSKENPKII